jgi:Flp pilus assembly protein TadD
MSQPTIDREGARPAMRGKSRVRSIAIGSFLVVMGALGGGCVATPRQASTESPPPQVPEGSTAAAAPAPDQPPAPRTDFQATPTDRQRFQVHIDFGRVFESQGNFDAAVLEYQEALTVLETRKHGTYTPADGALAHRRMGGALDRLGRFAQAEVHYKKAQKLTPKDPKIWNDAGYSYYLQGKWPDAERLLKTARKLAPDDERARVNLGLALAAQGKQDQALPLLALSNGDAAGHANLGYLLASTGQADLARRQYETALALRPDLELARRALARLDRQQGDPVRPSPSSDVKPQLAQSAAGRVDASVTPASAPRPKIPPPIPMGIPPAVKPLAPAAPQSSSTAPSMGVTFSDIPPPPPL